MSEVKGRDEAHLSRTANWSTYLLVGGVKGLFCPCCFPKSGRAMCQACCCLPCMVARHSAMLDGNSVKCCCLYPGTPCKNRAQMIGRQKFGKSNPGFMDLCIIPCLCVCFSEAQIEREMQKRLYDKNEYEYCAHETNRRVNNIQLTRAAEPIQAVMDRK